MTTHPTPAGEDAFIRDLGGGNPGSGPYLKFVDPEETERERFEWYKQMLARRRDGSPCPA